MKHAVYAPLIQAGGAPSSRPATSIDGVIHGVGVPPQGTDPSAWPYKDTIPFTTWDGRYTGGLMHVPMSWAGELPDESHRGRPLLVCNESHFVNQGNQTPAQVAAIIASLSGWGDLVIGNWHYKDGREHAEETCKMLGPSGAVRALGVHVYSILSEPVRDGIWLDRLRWWKQFADEQGLPIWVTEWGFLGHPADTIVQRMAGLGETIRVVLRPQYMFWFSWRYGAYWPPSDMWDGARLTPVGREWMRLYGR